MGAAQPPKAKRYGETTTPTTSTYYEGMPEDYRWFRQEGYVGADIDIDRVFDLSFVEHALRELGER